MATVSQVISTFEQYWGYVPSRFLSMDPNDQIDDSYLDYIKNNVPDQSEPTTSEPEPTGTTTTTTETVSVSDVIAIFEKYGLDPYTHFDGTSDPQRPQRIANEINGGQRSLADLESTLSNFVETTQSGGTATQDPTGVRTQGQMGFPEGTFDNSGVTRQDVVQALQADGWEPGTANSAGEFFEDAVDRIYGQLQSGTRSWDNVQWWITNADQQVANPNAPGEFGGLGDDVPTAVGAEGYPGIMPGGRLVRLNRAGASDTWAVVYQIPGGGNYVGYVFPDVESLAQALGPGWQERIDGTVSQTWWNQNVVAESDDLTAIVGADESFQTFWNEMVSSAAATAGANDPTIVGEMFSDPQIQQILAQGAIGAMSGAQVQAEIRRSNFYTQRLYPGIQRFYEMGSTDPEGDWATYMSTVRTAASSAGISLSREEVGQMLNAGVDDEAFATSIPMFVRAKNSPGFFNIFNEWTQAELGQQLDFETWLDFLEGTAATDLYDVYERATLQFQAEQTGADFADQDLINRVAEASDLSEGQASQRFLNAGRVLRQLDRAILLNKYGLTEDDLVSLEFGVRAPSGRSLDEIAQRAEQAVKEERLLGTPKESFFVGFDESGRPTRPGLQPLSPERG